MNVNDAGAVGVEHVNITSDDDDVAPVAIQIFFLRQHQKSIRP